MARDRQLILNRYRPIGEAKAGGFGTVRVAWDTRIQRKVAIKCIELDEVDASRLIIIQRAALYQELHRITEQRLQLDPHSQLAQILLMDKAAMHLEADLRWLDMIESRLDEVIQQPAPKPTLRPRGRPPSHE